MLTQVNLKEDVMPKQKEYIDGGLAEGKSEDEFDPEQIKLGIEVEKEHTPDENIAKEIAKDHLTEDPKYYTHLQEFEKTFQHKAAEESATKGPGQFFDPKQLAEEEPAYTKSGMPEEVIQLVKNKIDIKSLDEETVRYILRYNFNALRPTVKNILLEDDDFANVYVGLDYDKAIDTITRDVGPLIRQELTKNEESTIGEVLKDPGREKLEAEPLQTFVDRVFTASNEGPDGLMFSVTSGTNPETVSFELTYDGGLLALGIVNRLTDEFSLTLATPDLNYDNVTKYYIAVSLLKDKGLKDITVTPLPMLSKEELEQKEKRTYNIPLYTQYRQMLRRLSKATGFPEDDLFDLLTSVFGSGSVEISNKMVKNPKLFPEHIETVLLGKLQDLKATKLTSTEVIDSLLADIGG